MPHPEQWAHIRREYESKPLQISDCHESPIQQFMLWFEDWQIIQPLEPTAMVLSTVDAAGHPDSRVVLLKGLWQDTFLFYTHYTSVKGQQIANESHVALNFYWPELSRQVRIKGIAQKVPEALSDEYFASRPFASQCSAAISHQSHEIESRDILEDELNRFMEAHQSEKVERPKHWGGYAVSPIEIEFWQGRTQRLHDRIQYFKQAQVWRIRRLAP